MQMFSRRGAPLGSDAQWLIAWSQDNVRKAAAVGAGDAEALVARAQDEAESASIFLKRGLKELGYSKLEDYILDQLDERLEDDDDARPSQGAA